MNEMSAGSAPAAAACLPHYSVLYGRYNALPADAATVTLFRMF